MSAAPSTLDRIRCHLVGLKMPRALEVLEHTLRQLERGEVSALEAIDALLGEELSLREGRRVKAALKMGRLLTIKTLAGFDFAFQPSLDKNRILALAQLGFVDHHEVVHFLGQPGCGKTHLALALGVEAVKARRSVYFATLADLVGSLAKAEREGTLRERLRFLCRPQLLIVDEIGYLPVIPGGGNLFFQLVNARYERGAMILTSNRGFAETSWTWLHKLRRAMVRPGRDRPAGEIEADETYVGGPEEGKRGRAVESKAIVAVAAEQRGRGIVRIRLRRVKDVFAESLLAFLQEAVEPGATIHTDGWRGYAGLPAAGFRHQVTVISGGSEPAHEVMPRVHKVAALLKRWLLGTLQGGIQHQHLDDYLDEFTFRLYGASGVKLSMSASSSFLCRVHLGGGSPAAVWRASSEGSSPLARIIAPQACIRWTRGDPDHDAAMRIGGEAPGRRAHSSMRHESHRKARVTATSDRHRQPAGEPWAGRKPSRGPRCGRARSRRRTQDDTVRRLAGGHQTPQRDEQLARQRHDHGLARAAASVRRPRPVPDRQTAGLLEPEKTPGELDHAAAHARVARLGEPLLPPPGAALLRRARQAGVAGYRPSVAQVAREDLVHQHVRRLDADADHACQQPNHRVRPFFGCLLQSFEARLLDLGDLAGHEAQPRVARQPASVFGGKATPSSVRSVSRSPGAMRKVGLKLRMPGAPGKPSSG